MSLSSISRVTKRAPLLYKQSIGKGRLNGYNFHQVRHMNPRGHFVPEFPFLIRWFRYHKLVTVLIPLGWLSFFLFEEEELRWDGEFGNYTFRRNHRMPFNTDCTAFDRACYARHINFAKAKKAAAAAAAAEAEE